MPIGKLRAALLASAALAALCLPPAQPVLAGPDPCTYSTSEQALICSGDQSGGISDIIGMLSLFVTCRATWAASVCSAANPSRSSQSPDPTASSLSATMGMAFRLSRKGRPVLRTIFAVATGGPVRYGNGIVASVFSGTGPVEVINSGDLTLDGYALRGIEAEFGTRRRHRPRREPWRHHARR